MNKFSEIISLRPARSHKPVQQSPLSSSNWRMLKIQMTSGSQGTFKRFNFSEEHGSRVVSKLRSNAGACCVSISEEHLSL